MSDEAKHLYLCPMLGGPGALRYPVTEQAQVIGRSETADISLLEPTISRRHATVQLVEGKVTLVDLGSKHGTFVNSRRIDRSELRVGDIVVFGLSLVLRLEQSEQPVRVSTPNSFTEAPTLVASREPVLRSETGHQPAYVEQPTISRSADVGSLCASLLPEAHIRLSELRLSLKQMVDKGVDETDPYPILASVESVLGSLAPVMQSLRGEETAGLMALRSAVNRVIARVTHEFRSDGVTFLADIAPTCAARGNAATIETVLQALLRGAAARSSSGNPVKIEASSVDMGIELTVCHLGRSYQTDGLTSCEDLRQLPALLQRIGAEIALESRPGVGSTVRIKLES